MKVYVCFEKRQWTPNSKPRWKSVGNVIPLRTIPGKYSIRRVTNRKAKRGLICNSSLR